MTLRSVAPRFWQVRSDKTHDTFARLRDSGVERSDNTTIHMHPSRSRLRDSGKYKERSDKTHDNTHLRAVAYHSNSMPSPGLLYARDQDRPHSKTLGRHSFDHCFVPQLYRPSSYCISAQPKPIRLQVLHLCVDLHKLFEPVK
jgi:hypothetical protein